MSGYIILFARMYNNHGRVFIRILLLSFYSKAETRKAKAGSLSCELNWPEQKTGQRRTNEEEGEELNELEQKLDGGGRVRAAHT